VFNVGKCNNKAVAILYCITKKLTGYACSNHEKYQPIMIFDVKIFLVIYNTNPLTYCNYYIMWPKTENGCVVCGQEPVFYVTWWSVLLFQTRESHQHCHQVFMEPCIRVDRVYYLEMLLSQQLLPAIKIHSHVSKL